MEWCAAVVGLGEVDGVVLLLLGTFFFFFFDPSSSSPSKKSFVVRRLSLLSRSPSLSSLRCSVKNEGMFLIWGFW